ncbi:hypothetical protein ACFVYI_35240, partial [Kitasatospora sp. NPDC058218]
MSERVIPVTGREWHLVERPQGWPAVTDFALVEAPVRTPGPGEILVRNAYLSVDPYMRGRMSQLDMEVELGAKPGIRGRM